MHFHLDVVCNKRVLHLHSVKFVTGVKFTFMKVIRVTSVCYTFIKMWLQQKTLYLNTGVVCYMSVFHFHVSVLCYKRWFYFFKDVVPYKHRLHFRSNILQPLFKKKPDHLNSHSGISVHWWCSFHQQYIFPWIYPQSLEIKKKNNRHGLLRL